MRFGLLVLPDAAWRDARRRWQTAERLGFDHAWTYDHLTWRFLRDGPWFGAIPTLAAAATVNEALPAGDPGDITELPAPVPLAKELMQLDDLSDGRVTAGTGAGGDGFDATATRDNA